MCGFKGLPLQAFFVARRLDNIIENNAAMLYKFLW